MTDEIAPGVDIENDNEMLDWVKKNAETTYHPVGTCKMGNDPMAVVDAQPARAWRRGVTRRRRFDHADDGQWQHQRRLYHDRRKMCRPVERGSRGGLTPAAEHPGSER